MPLNNAAIRRHVPFLEMSLADRHAIRSVIPEGAFLMSRAAIPPMIAGGGTIATIGGVTAHPGADERARVSAAEAGRVGLTRAIAVADRGSTANCVFPRQIGGKRSATSGASAWAAMTAAKAALTGSLRRRAEDIMLTHRRSLAGSPAIAPAACGTFSAPVTLHDADGDLPDEIFTVWENAIAAVLEAAQIKAR